MSVWSWLGVLNKHGRKLLSHLAANKGAVKGARNCPALQPAQIHVGAELMPPLVSTFNKGSTLKTITNTWNLSKKLDLSSNEILQFTSLNLQGLHNKSLINQKTIRNLSKSSKDKRIQCNKLDSKPKEDPCKPKKKKKKKKKCVIMPPYKDPHKSECKLIRKGTKSIAFVCTGGKQKGGKKPLCLGKKNPCGLPKKRKEKSFTCSTRKKSTIAKKGTKTTRKKIVEKEKRKSYASKSIESSEETESSNTYKCESKDKCEFKDECESKDKCKNNKCPPC